MSLDTDSGKVVHFPSNPDVFRFDEEVAKIFPDMARRAIPMYLEGHRAHAAMLRPILETCRAGCRILDIGASRGQFFHALIEAYGRAPVACGDMLLTALDNSAGMLRHMRDDFLGLPIGIHEVDITSDEFMGWDHNQFDVVNMNYVLQFIHPSDQQRVLKKVCDLVAPGGVLILGQKDKSDTMLGEMAHEEYMEFRIRNGYSRDEITAKTRALKGSMYPMSHADLLIEVYQNGFREVYETTRWMMFNTLFCIK
jgi:tRNA (cmo5U34)-methyltransferase